MKNRQHKSKKVSVLLPSLFLFRFDNTTSGDKRQQATTRQDVGEGDEKGCDGNDRNSEKDDADGGRYEKMDGGRIDKRRDPQ